MTIMWHWQLSIGHFNAIGDKTGGTPALRQQVPVVLAHAVYHGKVGWRMHCFLGAVAIFFSTGR
jgi:hypothetical protein